MGDPGGTSYTARPSAVRRRQAQRTPLPGARPGTAPRPAALALDVDLVAARLALSGRLDASTTHVLHDGLALLRREQHQEWTIDLGGLTAIDDAGVRALSAAYRHAVRHGRRIVLLGASSPLQHVLALLRLDRHVLCGEAGRGQLQPGRGTP